MKKHYKFIDLATVVSALAVVFLHTNAIFWGLKPGAKHWLSANLIETIFIFAVPVFFMISGATLMDYIKKYNTKVYFKKRLKRAFVPYIIWSFIGLALQVLLFKTVAPDLVNVKYILNGLFSGSLVGIYWFFIPLFICYLAIPLLTLVPDKDKLAIYSYLAAIIFIFNITLPFINKVLNLEISNISTMGANVGLQSIFYLLMGYIILKREITLRRRLVLYSLGLIGAALSFVLTHLVSCEAGKIISEYKGAFNVLMVPYCLAVFTCFRYEGEKLMEKQKIANIITCVKPYTFVIYLTHYFVLQILWGYLKIDNGSLVNRLVLPFIAIAIVIIMTKIYELSCKLCKLIFSKMRKI